VKPLPPAYVREYLTSNPTQRARDAAAALGLSIHTIGSYRSTLIKAGMLRPLYTNLTRDDALELIHSGITIERAARILGRSAAPLRKRLYRVGVVPSYDRIGWVYTAQDVAILCGLHPKSGSRVVRRWHRDGLINVRRRKRGQHWRMTADDLRAFFSHPDCPIDPARITDPDWRAFAQEKGGYDYAAH
jgi:hypothetical protein